MTYSIDIMDATKIALRDIVRPWEVLCGFTDIGDALVPEIYSKSPEEYEKHITDYMDAPTPMINKETGDIGYANWDDEAVNSAIKQGKYIRIQDKPKYARE